MKLLLLFLCLISSFCLDGDEVGIDNGYCNYKEDVTKKSDCQSIKNVDEGFMCCYVHLEDEDGNNIQKCHAVQGEDGLDEYAEAVKDYEYITILCGSEYIKNYAFLLLLFVIYLY